MNDPQYVRWFDSIGTSLLAPIEPVAGHDTVMPLPRLEDFCLPNVARIGSAVDRAMAYS